MPDPAPAAQAAILTITLNPALDLSSETDRVVPELKLRCSAPLVDPGGGGINVSRAIARLGGDSTPLVSVAGHTGARLEDALRREGLRPARIPAPGETRQSLSVTCRETGRQYRFVMPGPAWGRAEVQAALIAAGEAAQPGGFAVLSGSQPPGVPDDFPARLAAALAGHESRLIMDTSGPALAELVARPTTPAPFVLRMDGEEARALAGGPLPDLVATGRFAHDLVRRGAAHAVICARGPEGSVMATADGAVHCPAARVDVVSKVGAGDSFVGAFTLALGRGGSLAEALRHGVAAASAAVMTAATQLCRPEDVARLLPECTLSDLPV